MNSDHGRAHTALREFGATRPAVEGTVVASTDGILIVHDLGGSETYGIEPSGVAALAAVHLGLSRRLTDTASHGNLVETVVRGSFGQIVTYPSGPQALLSVLLRSGVEADELQAVCGAAQELATQLADILTPIP